MDVLVSMSLKMDEFISLKKKIVSQGGNKDQLITTMEDITRMAVSGSRFQERPVKDWGLYLISLYDEQTNAKNSLNKWSMNWHDLINECLKLDDAQTCQYLNMVIIGGLF